ncbi:helix-turn-helix domain-containing protein [Hymenobacter sediminis]|uniref:helix-turn-helix domain-containing protein n=1 Tax=Hymenobacter sediminis TaxID=2218621 RepID=UPI001390059A|nr:helix-turn-helix transcriptional regulator [Hymenobacter sediminis]
MKNAAGILAFGRHVRQLREERGLSQQALADEADIAKPTIQRIEKGQAAATLEVLLSLSKALDLPFREFANAPGIDE